MESYFPIIKIRGGPEDRGRQQGTLLKERIHRTIEFYKRQILIPEEDVLRIARQFRESTRVFREELYVEIEALANAAGAHPLWIYALNGRTELLNLNPMECTSLAFKKQGLIGQNWDWDSEVEELAVILDIEREDGHRIVTMTEPGMIGKIGMNSEGIGACLNILLINKPLNGVPIHIVLRSILESRTLEEAKLAIQKSGYGKASNILFGDREGNFNYIEYAGDERFLKQSRAQFMVHTNHYLARPINPNYGDFCNSYTRFRVAYDKASALSNFTIDEMKTILTDRSDREYPIWRAYEPDADLQELGTVATIVMDLKAKQLHIRKGNIKYPEKDSNATTRQNLADSFANDFVIAFEN